MQSESPRPFEYVVPLRATDAAATDDLFGYLADLADAGVDVTVVDSSPPAVFTVHRCRAAGAVRHLRVDPWPGRNGKVAGVVTGVRAARHERVVVADDDVRYTVDQLRAATRALDEADLVRPQNAFDSLPWHARWDTARTLLNRAFGHDHPGTFALRRSTFLAMGGYDGDVLFENLELSRTVRAAGGIERDLPSLFVARRPPTVRHFLGQRVRQAYDDLGQPLRLTAEAAALPGAVLGVRLLSGRSRGVRWLTATGAVLLPVVLAETGRRRHDGRTAFAPTAALWAPLWVTERAACVWLALLTRARGGVRYSDGRIRVAAHSVRRLRRGAAGRRAGQPGTTR